MSCFGDVEACVFALCTRRPCRILDRRRNVHFPGTLRNCLLRLMVRNVDKMTLVAVARNR